MIFRYFVAVAFVLVASAANAQQAPDSAPPRPNPAAIDSGNISGALAQLPPRERGVAFSSIDARVGRFNSAPSLPIALQALVPGVSVSQGQGFLGSTSRVWLRGPGSLFVNQPLLVIDGARTHAAQDYWYIENDILPSRLEDLDPETIERVEILPGIASAAMYGPGASKGVIVVTTKRGVAGPARWSAFAESGALIEPTAFPANFGTLGVSTTTGAPGENCFLSAQAAGSCTPTIRRSWNPLESASPFRTGWNNSAGVSVAGGALGIVYFGALNHDRATGVYDRDRGQTMNARINVAMSPSATFDVRLIAGYRTEHFDRPTYDYITGGLRGASADDPVQRGYRFFGQSIEAGARADDDDRTTVTLSAAWRPHARLRTSANVGFDRLAVEQSFRVRRPGFVVGLADSITFVDERRDVPSATTAGVEAVSSYGRDGAHRTVAGAQYIREDDRASTRSGDASGLSFSASWLEVKRVTAGLYLQQHAGWNDRFFLTASIRGDHVVDGPARRLVSASVDGAWVAISPSTRGTSRWLGDLRLRAAYGHGGGHLIPTVPLDASGRPAGEGTETAEAVGSLEVGLDASLLANRVTVKTTFYRAVTDQALATTILPPSEGGFPDGVLTNDATIRTSGAEAFIDARLIDRDRFDWDLGLVVSAQTNEIRRLPGAPPIYGNGQSSAEGRSIGEYRIPPYSYADADGDGRIAPDEVAYGSEPFPAGGSPFPDYEAALRSEATLGERFRISAVLDRRAGQMLANVTERRRCGVNPQCEAQHDPSTSLAEQARAVASRRVGDAAYLEDASYTKLREVSIGLMLPQRWATIGGVGSARLTFTGRNLGTWTS